jgi:hypothetical protein
MFLTIGYTHPQVARRARGADWARQRAAGSAETGQGSGEAAARSRQAVRYTSCAVEEDVYLHPRSALHKVGLWVSIYVVIKWICGVYVVVKRAYGLRCSEVEYRQSLRGVCSALHLL